MAGRASRPATAVEEFLERQLDIFGGVAVEHRAESRAFPWDWGTDLPLSDIAGPDFKSLDTKTWFSLIHGNEEWASVETELPRTVVGATSSREILRAPLGHGSEREVDAATLILFRESTDSNTLSVPPLAIVG